MIGRSKVADRYTRCQALLNQGCLEYSPRLSTAGQLSTFWRQVPIEYTLEQLPLQDWDLLDIETHTPCITEFNDALLNQNRWISDGDIKTIERRFTELRNTKIPNTLETFLADSDRGVIDTIAALRRLKGLLVDHHYRTNQHVTKVYQRLSSPYYHDVRILTYRLFKLEGLIMT